MKELQNKIRSSNMDMMRILSMILIVFLHSIDHSGVLESCAKGTPIYYFVYFGYFLSQICVNCFVLLSGYFLINSKFRLSKLVSLWLEVFFYSFVIRIIFIAIGIKAFSWTSIISCFVPVFTGRYWFITIYFGLYLVSPFLNIGLKALSKKQHAILNAVLFLLFSVMVSIVPSSKGMNSGAGWGLAWFVVLYVMASWFRLHYKPSGKFKLKILALFAMVVLVVSLLWVSSIIDIAIVNKIILNWYKYDSAIVCIMSVLTLVIFINIKCENSVVNKTISTIAPLTFGVYLIHAHADISPWMWEAINLPQYMNNLTFAPVQLGFVLLIFVSCIAIDWVRNKFFKLLQVDKLGEKIDKLIRVDRFF